MVLELLGTIIVGLLALAALFIAYMIILVLLPLLVRVVPVLILTWFLGKVVLASL